MHEQMNRPLHNAALGIWTETEDITKGQHATLLLENG